MLVPGYLSYVVGWCFLPNSGVMDISRHPDTGVNNTLLFPTIALLVPIVVLAPVKELQWYHVDRKLEDETIAAKDVETAGQMMEKTISEAGADDNAEGVRHRSTPATAPKEPSAAPVTTPST